MIRHVEFWQFGTYVYDPIVLKLESPSSTIFVQLLWHVLVHVHIVSYLYIISMLKLL